MLKYLFYIIIFSLPLSLFSQNQYEGGYVINSNGVKKACLLFNTGMENTGEDYIYKFEKNDQPQKIDIKNFLEFGVEGKIKYVREFIRLDVSGDQINTLNDTIGRSEILEGYAFLQQLVSSKAASLYYFYYEGKEYFFFRVGDSKISYLVFRKYQVDVALGVTTQILYNNDYKKQLAQFMPCSVNTKSLSYTRKSLLKYFSTYIEGKDGVDNISKSNPTTKGKFNVKIGVAYNQASYYAKDGDIKVIDFGSQSKITYGAELEYLIPFNRNKWGVFSEINFSEFQSTYTDPYAPGVESGINYSFIEFPFGVAYYSNLPNNFRLFVKSGYVPTLISGSSSIYFYNKSNIYELTPATNIFVGLGISYRSFRVEARVYSKRNITQGVFQRGSDYSQFSVRLSAMLFQLYKK